MRSDQPRRRPARLPDGRVDAGDEPDLPGRGPIRGEEKRHEAPGERVVEVIDESSLRAGGEARVGGTTRRRRLWRDLVPPHTVSWALAALLEANVRGSVAYEGDREHEPTIATVAPPTTRTSRAATLPRASR